MKTQITIPASVGDIIYLNYVAMTNAREYARSIAADPKSPAIVKHIYRSQVASLSNLIHNIESKIPPKHMDDFNRRFRKGDTLAYDNVQELMVRMTPEQQQMLETMANGIVSGEEIIFEQK